MWGGKITPLSNDSIIQSDFIVYKDIQVMNDSVYLLAQQRRYLVENNRIPETMDKNQFFSRGAVLCFDSFSAGAKDPAVIGFTEAVSEKIAIPLCDDEGYPYYWERTLERKQEFDFMWTRAVPEKGKDSQVLLGPQKFLAINPKKLVIADCGIVYYTDSNGLPKTEKQSRIATVDLESFAITSIGYDKNFGNCQINGSDYYTFSYYRNIGTSFGLYTELTGPTNGSAVSVSKYSFKLSYGLD